MKGDGESVHRDSHQPSQSQSQLQSQSQAQAQAQLQSPSQSQFQDAPAVDPAASPAASAESAAGAPRSAPSRALAQGRPSSSLPSAPAASTATRAGPTVTVDTDTDQHSSHAPSVNNKLQKKPKAPSSSASSSKKPQDPPKDPKDTQQKKKRRFFGLGGSSDSSSSSSAVAQQTSPTSGKGGFFARSLSTRSRPLSYQGSQVSRTPSVDKETWLSSASHLRPDPIAEESSPPTNRSNPSNRHSVAGLPLALPKDSKAPQQDLPSPNISPLAPQSAFKTSYPQSSDADEVGSKPSSAWSERSKAPAAQHYPPYNTQFLNISDSRPSSRQSLEPSSPVQAQGQYIAYHPHKAVSQSSVNKLDISRDPSPLHQQPPLQRLPSAQSTATGGE